MIVFFSLYYFPVYSCDSRWNYWPRIDVEFMHREFFLQIQFESRSRLRYSGRGDINYLYFKMNFESNALIHSIISNKGGIFDGETNETASTPSDMHHANGTYSNITNSDLANFAKQLLEFQHKQCKPNESIACQYYCNGFFKELFTSYKNMHGYISLAVSWIHIIINRHYAQSICEKKIGYEVVSTAIHFT